jgi:hypothetical protein
LSDRFSMRTAFLLMSVMFLLSAAFWLWGVKDLARDTARALESEQTLSDQSDSSNPSDCGY